jgi:uncharacterized protein
VAQSQLGYMYENGLGLSQDYSQALAWYKKAADGGYAVARGNLQRLTARMQNEAQAHAKANAQ